MINAKTLREFLILNHGKGELTWNQVGLKFNKTGNAARKLWKRIQLSTPTVDNYKDYPISYKKQKKKIKQSKVLVFDVESSPAIAYVWRMWKENINPTSGKLIQATHLLSWSAKWLFEETVMSMSLTPTEVKDADDSRIVKGLWNLFEEADILIAHNGKGFDIKLMNTRFVIYDLPSPSPYQVIDTLQHARKRFRMESNKLEYLGQVLIGHGKVETGGFKLWKECMEGCPKAMSKMVEYCNGDVLLLEAVYLKMRNWIKPHPNMNLFMETDSNCPTCGSTNIKRVGTYRTYSSEYESHRCSDCGSTSKKAKSSDKLTSISK